MATATNNQPRRGSAPSRQDPAVLKNGSAGNATDPTYEGDQAPADVFGFHNQTSTGLTGSAHNEQPSDVTLEQGQNDPGPMNVKEDFITNTGLTDQASQGAQQSSAGQTIRYTDVFGVQGGVNRDATTKGVISGPGDWTQANADGYSGGPTLPMLEGNRPSSTGLTGGHLMHGGRGTPQE
jgi:hypothetical protein